MIFMFKASVSYGNKGSGPVTRDRNLKYKFYSYKKLSSV